MGGLQGLDYVSVESVLRLLDIENKQEIFKDLRYIEMGALNGLKDGK